MFNRVTADTHTCMTTTAKHCIAAIGLNAYRHERSWHDLINLSIPVCLYASQSGSCFDKPTAALHLTVDGCTSRLLHLQLQR